GVVLPQARELRDRPGELLPAGALGAQPAGDILLRRGALRPQPAHQDRSGAQEQRRRNSDLRRIAWTQGVPSSPAFSFRLRCQCGRLSLFQRLRSSGWLDTKSSYLTNRTPRSQNSVLAPLKWRCPGRHSVALVWGVIQVSQFPLASPSAMAYISKGTLMS